MPKRIKKRADTQPRQCDGVTEQMLLREAQKRSSSELGEPGSEQRDKSQRQQDSADAVVIPLFPQVQASRPGSGLLPGPARHFIHDVVRYFGVGLVSVMASCALPATDPTR